MKVKDKGASFAVFGFKVDHTIEVMKDLLGNKEAYSDVVFIRVAILQSKNLLLEVLLDTWASITAWDPHREILAIVLELECDVAWICIIDGISCYIKSNLHKPLLISEYFHW